MIWSHVPGVYAEGASAERRAWQTIIDSGESNEMNHQWIVAELSYKNALSAAEKFGPRSQEVQSSLPRLAVCLVVQNKFEEAEPLYKRAVEIVYRLRSADPPTNPDPDSLVWLDDLADAYQDKAKEYKPILCMEHCTAIRRAIAPGRHSKLASALHALGSMYMVKQDWSHAEACYAEELEVLTNKYGPSDKHDAAALCSLGQARMNLKKYALARINLEHALAIMNAPPRTEDIYRSVIEKRIQEIIRLQASDKPEGNKPSK
jgi:Tetratricopeptide repeat